MKKIINCVLVFALLITTAVISYADGNEAEFKAGTYITTASTLNIRAGPSTKNTIVGKIPIGTVVQITTFDDNWGKVTYSNCTGWISMDYADVYKDKFHDIGNYAVKWNVIDVSKWQGKINWKKVANDGIKGVIIRIGLRGSATKAIHLDDKFLEYYKGAKEQGLHVGCYFYSAATSTKAAKEEAEFVIKTIKNNNIKLDMPAFLDVEDDVILKCGKTAIFNITKAYLDTMDDVNIYSGVYCSASWAKDYYNQSLFNTHALWVADWSGACDYTASHGMWQYSETSRVNGTETKYTDLNYCYVDYPKLIEDYKYNKDKIKEEDVTNEKTTTENNNAKPESPYLMGDVNKNNIITSSDARLALRFATLLEIPDEYQFLVADMNTDGKITSTDARTILRIVAMLDDISNYTSKHRF